MPDSESTGGRTVLAVGGHIGDMDLAAGPALAQNVLDGGASVLVALTPGERGHPRMPVAEYREVKIAEGRAFAEAIGASFEVFDDLSDGLLTDDEPTAARLALVLRRYRPDTLIAHWKHSIHSDHERASALAVRARYLAGLPGWHTDVAGDEGRRHGTARLLYSENWEDAEGYAATHHLPIGDEAFGLWRSAIEGEMFARGETYGFRYIDYYTAQLTLRGCLAGCSRAVGFSQDQGVFTASLSQG